jgi:hypothetical protein
MVSWIWLGIWLGNSAPQQKFVAKIFNKAERTKTENRIGHAATNLFEGGI